jgi:hypothetical protein
VVLALGDKFSHWTFGLQKRPILCELPQPIAE